MKTLRNLREAARRRYWTWLLFLVLGCIFIVPLVLSLALLICLIEAFAAFVSEAVEKWADVTGMFRSVRTAFTRKGWEQSRA